MPYSSIFTYYETNYLPLLPADRSAHILEVGCGKGALLEYLSKKGFENAVGVDTDSEGIEQCRARGLSNVEVIEDLEQFLSPRQSAYDVVILQEVLYYFPEQELIPYLKAILRSLKQGGKVVVEVFNGSAFSGPFVRYKDLSIQHIFTEHSLAAALREAGFTDVKVWGAVVQGSGVKGLLWKSSRFVWETVLRLIYTVERGFDPENPRILSKLLLSVGERGENA